VNLERALFGDGARPHAPDELVLGDQFASRPRQRLDDFERAASDRNPDPTSPQLAPAGVDFQGSSLVNQLRRWWQFRTPGSGFSGFLARNAPVGKRAAARTLRYPTRLCRRHSRVKLL
jgi:hypothetical protein